MTVEIVARPITSYASTRSKKTQYEQVELVDFAVSDHYPNGYCLGVVHVDVFYDKNDEGLYQKLIHGESVNMSLIERDKYLGLIEKDRRNNAG